MRKSTIQQFRTQSLLTKCLLASLTLHSIALYLFIKNPILLNRTDGSLFLKTKPEPSLVKGEESWKSEDAALDQFFKEFAFTQASDTLDEEPLTSCQKPVILLNENELLVSWPNIPTLDDHQKEANALTPLHFTFKDETLSPLDTQEFLLTHPNPIPHEKTNPHSPAELLSFLPEAPLIEDKLVLDEDLPSNVVSPVKEPIILKNHNPSFSSKETLCLEGKKNSFVLPESSQLFSVSEERYVNLQKESSLQDSAYIQGHIIQGSLALIDDYLPAASIFALKWNDNFTITPSFFPDEDGYVFSLTVTPAQDLETQKMKHNIYFLIDISSEVEKHKISVFKKSALKALSSLQPGDYFNVLLIDKKITKLSPYSLPFSFKNLQLAEEFLERKHDKALFSSFDLFKGLSETLDTIKDDDEVHTVILLTNGKITTNSALQKKAFQNLIEKNSGKVTLFTAAVGQNNNLVNLDMLSSFCGGKMLYSDTNASFPRKLATFVKNLTSPLAKNVSIFIEPKDVKADLTILPSFQIPNLYNKDSFVIMGRVDRLCSLQFTLEGKNEEGTILLNKEIDFETATESPNALKKEWALRQTAKLYDNFLKDSKSEHLKEAREILKTAHGRTLGE